MHESAGGDQIDPLLLLGHKLGVPQFQLTCAHAQPCPTPSTPQQQCKQCFTAVKLLYLYNKRDTVITLLLNPQLAHAVNNRNVPLWHTVSLPTQHSCPVTAPLTASPTHIAHKVRHAAHIRLQLRGRRSTLLEVPWRQCPPLLWRQGLQNLIGAEHRIHKVGCTFVHLVLRKGHQGGSLRGGVAWAVVKPVEAGIANTKLRQQLQGADLG